MTSYPGFGVAEIKRAESGPSESTTRPPATSYPCTSPAGFGALEAGGRDVFGGWLVGFSVVGGATFVGAGGGGGAAEMGGSTGTEPARSNTASRITSRTPSHVKTTAVAVATAHAPM